ncbi:MAG: ACT domain-containing protein [Acidobacteria bacterium]|nr:ACT domain-containing protein [Acidobacteriota bacterium]
MEVYKQLSIFLENEPGTLARVCDALSENKINILAHNVHDSIDYSIFRCVVSDPTKAVHLLEPAGVFVLENDVLGIPVTNAPGALGTICKKLAKAKINIDYAYGSAAQKKGGLALLILKTDNMKKTREVLA